ncbi:hypothetical protein DOTSEDRAFT_76884 [Dothistroma septosporum NZE10]|uniref:C3HC-type domain-containing protein n=1 Tax=Dothistroma septosporum (strain NZE10 / CBS 128990) TaxID=675120 RepID=N1Q4D2_DOTSN|nr:hypothetical protein DOTSEDRAFT_76884 [Dothistroma septosporum NZE10]
MAGGGVGSNCGEPWGTLECCQAHGHFMDSLVSLHGLCPVMAHVYHHSSRSKGPDGLLMLAVGPQRPSAAVCMLGWSLLAARDYLLGADETVEVDRVADSMAAEGLPAARMPEAIATTKRKFYKALDALTSSSSTSALSKPVPDTSTANTSRTKRSSAAAFEEARERVRKRLRHSTSTSSLDASVISLAQGTCTKKPTGPPPHFSPWSQDTFLARLKSFSSVSLWHPKPDVINEVAWAKRGWVCVDVNTVACRRGCERRVVVSLDILSKTQITGDKRNDGSDDDDDDDDTSALEEALAERYKTAIVDGHSSSCLWHQQGCKDDIYRLPVVRPSVWQPDLRRRLHCLASVQDSVERIVTRPIDTTNHKLLHEMPHDMLGIDSPPDARMSKAFEIAMHGWRGVSDCGNQLLTCDACFQRIGLWLYQPDYVRPRSRSSEEVDDVEEAVLDLTDTHRDHCPWRNPESQRATGSLEGLNAIQILHRVVGIAARDHRRRSDRVHDENGLDEAEEEDTSRLPDPPIRLSRAEIEEQDKERESRLRKIKDLFNIKRRTTKAPVQRAS